MANANSQSLETIVGKINPANLLLQPNIILVDCRSTFEYEKSHIIGALSLTFPKILWRRIIKKPECLDDYLSPENKILQRRHEPNFQVVIYDECTSNLNDFLADTTLKDIVKIMIGEQTTSVSIIEGGFRALQEIRPDLIITTSIAKTSPPVHTSWAYSSGEMRPTKRAAGIKGLDPNNVNYDIRASTLHYSSNGYAK